MALVTTPGAADADSYATLAEADAYNASRPFSTAWAGTDAVKEAALREAARLLDSSFRWTGAAVDETQALTWPRSGMSTRNGFAIPTTGAASIPKALKEAQSEFARQLLAADRTADSGPEKKGITSLKVGPVAIGYRAPGTDSGSLELRDADVIRLGPDFDYLSRFIPDAVRNLLPPSWYAQATVSRGFLFEVDR